MNKEELTAMKYRGRTLKEVNEIALNIEGHKLNDYDQLIKTAITVRIEKINILKLKEIEGFLFSILQNSDSLGCESILKNIQKQIRFLGY